MAVEDAKESGAKRYDQYNCWVAEPFLMTLAVDLLASTALWLLERLFAIGRKYHAIFSGATAEDTIIRAVFEITIRCILERTRYWDETSRSSIEGKSSRSA